MWCLQLHLLWERVLAPKLLTLSSIIEHGAYLGGPPPFPVSPPPATPHALAQPPVLWDSVTVREDWTQLTFQHNSHAPSPITAAAQLAGCIHYRPHPAPVLPAVEQWQWSCVDNTSPVFSSDAGADVLAAAFQHANWTRGLLFAASVCLQV